MHPTHVTKSFLTGVLAFVLLSFSPGFGVAQPSKIGGEIIARMKVKKAASALPKSAQQAFLEKQNIVTERLDAETCAVYVDNPLSDSDIKDLAINGIIIQPESYVPPVDGKHPRGYYLAEMEYDAIPVVEKDSRIAFINTAELLAKPLNDLGRAMINTDDVHAGTGLMTPYDGNGAKIAIADSGIDLSHPDFPVPVETYDMTDGTSTVDWDTNVDPTVDDHGTHVSGSAVGSGGLSGGTYAGGGPGADLYFYKIGNDIDAGASFADEVEAVNRALAVGCDIYSMSYGGYDEYLDGSDIVSQAIDAAVDEGTPGEHTMTCFVAAGNSAASQRHYSEDIAPSTSGTTWTLDVDNTGGGSTFNETLDFRVIWQDDFAGDFNMSLSITGLGGGESFSGTPAFEGVSTRGTEGQRYQLSTNVGAGSSNSYTLQLTNNAGSGDTPKVHVYRVTGTKGTFTPDDPNYTLLVPAIADNAIAVGAWTQRKTWTNYQGTGYQVSSFTVGTRAPFSSIGPRIDGITKPDIAAPGAVTISTRDSTFSTDPALRIDNDGTNDGLGPADYYAKWGTSMACPMAAGSAASLVQIFLDNSEPFTAAELRSYILNNADSSVKQIDNETGYGLMDTHAAAQAIEAALPTTVDEWILFY